LDSELIAVREAVLAALTGVVLPRLSDKLLAATRDAEPDEWHLLGRIFGRVENNLKKRFQRIRSRRELTEVALYNLSEELLESHIKSNYLFARAHALEPQEYSALELWKSMRTKSLQPTNGLPNEIEETNESLEKVLAANFGVPEDVINQTEVGNE